MYTIFYARRVAPKSPAPPRVTRTGKAADARRRMPLVLLIAVCVVATTAAVSGPGASSSGLSFAQVGHWIANSADDTVQHVDGGASEPDVTVRIPTVRPGSRMVQNADSAFVIDDQSFRRIDKSNLAVTRQTPTPTADEPAFPLEAVGGPYSVYRAMGRVVRLGADPRVIDTGGSISDPVVTPDGTLWMIRTDTDELCHLAADATLVSCPFPTPAGHDGALTVVGGQVAYLDITARTLAPVGERGLGRPRVVALHLPPDARVAAADVQGWIAVVGPGVPQLHLIDGRNLDVDVSGRPPVSVTLPAGGYEKPVAARSTVVLLETHRREVLTYDVAGQPVDSRPLADEGGTPRISRGEDGRVYVDGGEGRNVHVVDEEGRIAAVSLGGGSAAGTEPTPPGQRTAVPPKRQGSRPQPPTGSTPPPGPVRPNGDPAPRRDPAAPGTRPAPGTRTSPPASRPPGNPPPGTPPATPPPSTPPPSTPPPSTPPPGNRPPGGGTPDTDPTRPGGPVPPVARPPQAPPNVRAVISGLDVIVTWDAPADNGAAVSAYHLAWTSPSGGGNQTSPGTARTATLSDLTAGIRYRITVAAQNSAGRGAPASVDLAMRTVTVSRGETTQYENTCLPPQCAYIRSELRGFAPNTDYLLKPWSNKWGNFNGGATLKTNSEGVLITGHRFPYSGVGDLVWVTVDGVGPDPVDRVESNHFLWPEAP